MSYPWALFESRFFIILLISAIAVGIDESGLVVFRLNVAGISFVLSIRVQYLVKN